MRIKEFDLDLPDVDTDGIAELQQLVGAGNLILNGALADLGTALRFDVDDAGYSAGVGGVQIAIDSSGDVNTVVFTVTGLDADGKTQTEDITGVTTTAVESAKYFSRITTIAADAAVGSDVFVGPVDEATSRTIPLNWRAATAATINVDVTGTINFTVQETFDNVQVVGQSAQQNAQWINISALASKTADTTSTATLGATAVRILINSYSSGGELQMNVNQPSEYSAA